MFLKASIASCNRNFSGVSHSSATAPENTTQSTGSDLRVNLASQTHGSSLFSLYPLGEHLLVASLSFGARRQRTESSFSATFALTLNHRHWGRESLSLRIPHFCIQIG